ncbi:family 16 glycoside hydrolase [Peribacillus sp. NPDC097895]|uniref:family 16 glycoside hydrolase n=1 Tax=Peribacillus sp. NPDC097895 TaxID=3390619 RepID=UPI003D073554
MKCKLMIVQLLVLTLFISCVFPFSAQAAKHHEISDYFSDHFDKTIINDKWNVIEGPWSFDSGKLTVSKGAGYKAIAKDTTVSDFTLETDISLADQNGDAGVLFRVNGAVPGADNVKGYYAGVSANGTGSVFLGRMNNNYTELKRAAVIIKPNTSYHLKVTAVGSKIQIYVNGDLVLEQTDSTYAKGSIGIRSYNSQPSYDNFTASTMDGSSLFLDTFDIAPEQAIDSWNIINGSWELSSGSLRVNKGESHKILAKDSQFDDMTLEVNIKLPGDTGNGDAGLLFGLNKVSKGEDGVRGYYAGISVDGHVTLNQMKNNKRQVLKTSKVFDRIDPNKLYHLKVVTNKNDIRVYVNDTVTPVIQYRDKNRSQKGKGGVGLQTNQSQASFDNFIASAYVIQDKTFKEPIANKKPLIETPFTPLPLGSVEAKGWLQKQLELQRDGATGHAEDLYSELGTNAAWLGGTASDSDWERPVYYLKGLIPLAYTLNDEELIATSQKWMNAILASQRKDGSFGPETNDDWWPRMVALYAMKDYYEASGDERVLPFMTNYFKYQAANLPAQPLKDWGKIRVGDNIDTVLWLYNRTADASLLELTDLLAGQGYPIADIFNKNKFQDFGSDFQPIHSVNVNEAIKMPAVYYQRSHAKSDREAFGAGVKNLSNHNQITGMTSGTEMLAGTSSTQGVELCAITERMQSNEESAMILGDPKIGDDLEKITFNSLPGAMDKEIKNHQYYSLPNQVESNHADHGFKQNYSNGMMPSPTSGYPCCRFNMHMGWPYFVKNMWAASADGGIGVIAYGPSQVSVRLKKANVTIKETTNYPFEDQIKFNITSSKKVQFPLKLRIPAWSVKPTVTVNGESVKAVKAGEYVSINRKWKSGDKVVLQVPMKLKTTTWINNSIGIERGPLVYSLQMKENWQVKDKPIAELPGFDASALGFNEYTVKADNPWNYGLLIDREHPEKSIDVITGPMPENPFKQATTPVKLVAKAKKIPTWGKAANNVESAEPPAGPILSKEPTENITMVPYGAQNLRITYFPEVTEKLADTGAAKYEAEQADLFRASVRTNEPNASGGSYVGGIDFADSYVKFNQVNVPKAGNYNVDIWFANGLDPATGKMIVNGEASSLKYQNTRNWGRFMATKMEVPLKKGTNTITFMKDQGFYELDYIVVRPLQTDGR